MKCSKLPGAMIAAGSGDVVEGEREQRGRRQRRLDDKLSTCPEIGKALPMETERQSVEAQGMVCMALSLAHRFFRVKRWPYHLFPRRCMVLIILRLMGYVGKIEYPGCRYPPHRTITCSVHYILCPCIQLFQKLSVSCAFYCCTGADDVAACLGVLRM